jgi:hypothetical protein
MGISYNLQPYKMLANNLLIAIESGASPIYPDANISRPEALADVPEQIG